MIFNQEIAKRIKEHETAQRRTCVCAGNSCPECQEPDPETNPAAALVAEAIEASWDCHDASNVCHEFVAEAQEELANEDWEGAAVSALFALESACGATSPNALKARAVVQSLRSSLKGKS